MKQPRARWVMAQSVITAVLLGVVAVTLLNPDHSSELFGVNVPGVESPSDEVSPPGNQANGGDENGDEGANAGATGQPTAAAGGVSPEASAGGTDTGAIPSLPTTPGDEGGNPGGNGGNGHPGPPEQPPGPPDEQYGDTLARLSAAVD